MSNTTNDQKPVHKNWVNNLFLNFLKKENEYNKNPDDRNKAGLEMSKKLYEAMLNRKNEE